MRKVPTDIKKYYTNEYRFVLQFALAQGSIDNIETKKELDRLYKLASEVD